MKVRLFVMIGILVLCLSSIGFCEDANYYSYEERQKRYHAIVDEEIAHIRKMEELKLQYEIYCKELALKNESIYINNISSSFSAVKENDRKRDCRKQKEN